MFDQIDLKMSTFNGQSMRVTADGLQQTCQEKRFIIKYAPRNKCNDSKPGFKERSHLARLENHFSTPFQV